MVSLGTPRLSASLTVISPETLVLLVRAYKETGAPDKSWAMAERLRTTNMPSLEQALAASGARDKAAQPPEPVAAR